MESYYREIYKDLRETYKELYLPDPDTRGEDNDGCLEINLDDYFPNYEQFGERTLGEKL